MAVPDFAALNPSYTVFQSERAFMPLLLNFDWEEVTASTTLSDGHSLQSASEFRYPARRMQPRQAAFYRNLIRLAEQVGSRILPVCFMTGDGQPKRLDSGCIKLAEQAGFINPLANSPAGVVEELELAWNPYPQAG